MAIFYTPPANVPDFDQSAAHAADLKQKWHDYIAARFGELVGGLFYDAANDPTPGVPPDQPRRTRPPKRSGRSPCSSPRTD
ncbi:hypothetical protein [Limnoglobus roseus]|uniref:Uncharacterized protein n=1 Tax=Limnoglobus roseus TaxID=2598579 RepID=A0A5C1A958_9BACT|nr:hypothetical protein [Limnoglobus roseus]QEL13644.1 hypothetical protein PX52LOC_00502 [Limnoglobus roseus]